jgi:methionine-rich copper-binding protein CopC
VKLFFSQTLEPRFSTVRLVDKHGGQVDRMIQRVDAGDPSLLRISLPPLVPGPYRVIWRVLSKDGHVTRGEFIFNVAP